MVLGERIRTTVRERTVFTYKDDDHPGARSASASPSPTTGVAADYEQMKHLAAAALAEAKVTGRNRCVFFNAEAPF